jgi:hypothetical protein
MTILSNNSYASEALSGVKSLYAYSSLPLPLPCDKIKRCVLYDKWQDSHVNP